MSRHYKVALLHPHPALDQLLPAQTADEFEALKADISSNQIYQPLVLCSDNDQFVVLDGRHRLRAATDLGLTEVPGILLDGLTEDDRIERGLRLNNRRNMDAQAKRELAAALLKRWPDRSDRSIGSMVGCDHKTVATVRGEMQSTGEIPQLERTTGKDGKERPASKPARTRAGEPAGKVSKVEPLTEAEQSRLTELEGIIEKGLQHLDVQDEPVTVVTGTSGDTDAPPRRRRTPHEIYLDKVSHAMVGLTAVASCLERVDLSMEVPADKHQEWSADLDVAVAEMVAFRARFAAMHVTDGAGTPPAAPKSKAKASAAPKSKAKASAAPNGETDAFLADLSADLTKVLFGAV